MDKYLSDDFKNQPIYKQLCRMILKYGNVIKDLTDEDFIKYEDITDSKQTGIMALKNVSGIYNTVYVFIDSNGNQISISASTKPFARGNIMVDKITAIYDTDSNSITYRESILDYERKLNGKVIETTVITTSNNVVSVENYKNEDLSEDDSIMRLIVENMTKTQQKKLSRGWKK